MGKQRTKGYSGKYNFAIMTSENYKVRGGCLSRFVNTKTCHLSSVLGSQRT